MKTLLLTFAVLVSASFSEAGELRNVRTLEPTRIERTPSRPAISDRQGCQYSMQCGPGEACVKPPNAVYGSCVDERSTVD